MHGRSGSVTGASWATPRAAPRSAPSPAGLARRCPRGALSLCPRPGGPCPGAREHPAQTLAVEQALTYGLYDLNRLESLILKQVREDFFQMGEGDDA